MHSKQALVSAFLLTMVLSAAVSAQEKDRFTIQVAAFEDTASARSFVDALTRAGEPSIWGEVEIPGRGRWARVFIGSFATQSEARRKGQSLLARAIIKEFLVKPASEIKSLSQPVEKNAVVTAAPSTPPTPSDRKEIASAKEAKPESISLPAARRFSAEMIPSLQADALPEPDAVRLALRLIAAGSGYPSSQHEGGLWVTGDSVEGLRRLRWIAGADSLIIELDRDGRARLNVELLAKAAGIKRGQQSALKSLDYISSNEGLMLLAQITEGSARYLLHIGNEAPTLGSRVAVSGSLNLDNNFDSRINPHRRLGIKLDRERPPERFDSLVAMNPSARWFNLRTGRMVPVGHVTFHELAEAYAKVALGLQYLAEGQNQGAHNQAIEREELLKLQRPLSDVVTTVGANRVLRSEEELRQFYAEMGLTGNQR